MFHHCGMELHFHSDSANETAEDFDAFTDRVMDALCDLEEVDEGILDPDITASLKRRSMVVTLQIEASTPQDAAKIFLGNTRAALHAATCGTARWPVFHPTRPPTVRGVDLIGV